MALRDKEYRNLNPSRRPTNLSSSPATIRKPTDHKTNDIIPSIFSTNIEPSKVKKQSYKKPKFVVHNSSPHSSNKNSITNNYSEGIILRKKKNNKSMFDLIDVKKLEKSSPVDLKMTSSHGASSSHKPTKSSELKIEGLIELSDDEKEKDNSTELSSFVNKLDPKNLLHSLEEQNKDNYKDILKKYKGIPPPIVLRKKLLERADKHMKVIKKILDQKQEPCAYYYLAKKQCCKSEHETMSTLDRWNIKWEKYFGGYYGFERQSIIGNHILDKFENRLIKFSNGNKTVSYWNISQFSTYVLANEIIIRMIMEDMNLDFKEAEEFCQRTTDYGIVVADSIETVNGDEEEEESEDHVGHDDSDVILVPNKKRKI